MKFSRLWLRQTPGTDIALVNGMMNVIIQEDLHDQTYVAERTENFEALKETVAKIHPEYVEQITGVPADQMIAAARMYAKAPVGSIIYCMGITQHTVGTDNVKTWPTWPCSAAIWALGRRGQPPARPRTTSRGPVTWAACPTSSRAINRSPTGQPREDGEGLGRQKPPRLGGHDHDRHAALHLQGRHQGLVHHGRKPALTDPDSDHAVKAMQSLELLVVQDIFLTETGKLADVVLPASSFAEKDGTFSNTERGWRGCVRPCRRWDKADPTGRSFAKLATAWASP